MDSLWGTALWRQFGAAIDMLENALVACPDSLWEERLWRVPPSSEFLPQFAEFWYLTYHTLFWLDLYLSGIPEEFAPPAPFTLAEVDPESVPLPEQSYTKDEIHGYLTHLRQKCHETLGALTDEQANRPIEFPWSKGRPISFLELQLYNLRHVQEHAAQLALFLGQHGIPDEALDWVPWAKGDTDGH